MLLVAVTNMQYYQNEAKDLNTREIIAQNLKRSDALLMRRYRVSSLVNLDVM